MVRFLSPRRNVYKPPNGLRGSRILALGSRFIEGFRALGFLKMEALISNPKHMSHSLNALKGVIWGII